MAFMSSIIQAYKFLVQLLPSFIKEESKEDYFELAPGSSMRMCMELEKRFPDLRGRQLELMMYLCLVARKSEIYDGVCEDAWLRTTITLKNHHRHHIFSHSGSGELTNELMAKVSKDPVLCQASWELLQEEWLEKEWLQRDLSATLTSRIEIRSNILPRKAYLERLQELQKSIVLDKSAVLDAEDVEEDPCCISRRGFYPIAVIKAARLEDVLLKEKVKKWRRNGGGCELEMHLRARDVQHTSVPRSLRNIEPNDVVWMEKDSLGTGSAATVYKVSWRKGTYAMKLYTRGNDPQREREIASRFLHPHIVHGFGYFEVDGRCRLLMEVLGNNLTRYAIENGRVEVKPLFSRADTFDVLLQIASAVEHLHLNNAVHGDLKPDNILLDEFEIVGNGRHFLAKVTDFGDAQINILQESTFMPAGDGTTRYAAPELLKWRTNREEVISTDPMKIDVYGFGAIAHEVLTGYPVYHERDVLELGFRAKTFCTGVIDGKLKPSRSEIWEKLRLEERFPTELIKLVEKCWELRPEDRPSFSEICEKIKKCKSTVQSEEDRAAEEKRAAEKKKRAAEKKKKRAAEKKKRAAEKKKRAAEKKKRATDLWKFMAAVSFLAFICASFLIKEKRAADPFKCIALVLFAFISTLFLMKFCSRVFLIDIWCRIREFRAKVKDK